MPAAKPDTSSRICPPSEGVPAEQAGEDKTLFPSTSYTLTASFRVRFFIMKISTQGFFISPLRQSFALPPLLNQREEKKGKRHKLASPLLRCRRNGIDARKTKQPSGVNKQSIYPQRVGLLFFSLMFAR